MKVSKVYIMGVNQLIDTGSRVTPYGLSRVTGLSHTACARALRKMAREGWLVDAPFSDGKTGTFEKTHNYIVD